MPPLALRRGPAETTIVRPPPVLPVSQDSRKSLIWSRGWHRFEEEPPHPWQFRLPPSPLGGEPLCASTHTYVLYSFTVSTITFLYACSESPRLCLSDVLPGEELYCHGRALPRKRLHEKSSKILDWYHLWQLSTTPCLAGAS